MDSTGNEVLQYEQFVNIENSRPQLVDAGVQLDLTDDLNKDETEAFETIPNYQNGLTDLGLKLPLTIQTSCVPINVSSVSCQVNTELLVIANTASDFINEQKVPLSPLQTFEGSEPVNKRICIEQNGQTYILSLQDGIDGLAGIVDLSDKTIATVAAAQILGSQENVPFTVKQGINQNWFTSRAEKETLHDKGHVWKQGMWSKEEIELLEANIRQYCEMRNITDPARIIFETSKDERKDFYRTVAKGLNRPLFAVYRRVIRMYDNKNHVGKYTPDELMRLKLLRATFGNDWQAIGSAMGRSASSIKDRCRLMKDNCNQGKWHPAEERRLAEAVYELANALPGEMISSGLSWATVADNVGTRSEKQCRTKWLNYLNWKEAGGTEWTREDDIALICRICAINAVDENHIDWSELAKDWSSVRSPQWLRGKWWSMKRHVPNANAASFQEICEGLYELFVLKVNNQENQTTDPSPDDLTLQQSQTFAHPKPQTILHSIPVTAPDPTTGIVVANISHDDLGLANGAFSSVTIAPVIQTVEMLPQNMQLTADPQSFLSSAATQTVPLSTDQIIIHHLTADGLQGTASMPIQISMPAQVVINNVSEQTTLTSLVSTQIPSVPSSPVGIQHHSLEEGQPVLIEEATYEHQLIEENNAIQQVSELEHNATCQTDPSAQFMLADPMLAANESPDISVSNMEPDKLPEEELERSTSTEV